MGKKWNKILKWIKKSCDFLGIYWENYFDLILICLILFELFNDSLKPLKVSFKTVEFFFELLNQNEKDFSLNCVKGNQ